MSINLIKKGFNIKDDKGHKIVAAIYLVTKHLSVSDPLAKRLRESAIELLISSLEAKLAHATDIIKLLETATLVGVIGEKNASIISYEVGRFVQDDLDAPVLYQSDIVHSFKKDIKKTNESVMSFIAPKKESPIKNTVYSISKTDRSDKILSFMKEKKSGTIKDIIGLFPSVSEKTIQRELGALVQNGSLSKRGNKRWSVYFYELK
jgi:hypothetical protein